MDDASSFTFHLHNAKPLAHRTTSLALCFGLFIAAGSFFLGPSNRPFRLLSTVGLAQHLSPALFSATLYLILTVLPLVLLVFWIARVRFTNAYKGKSMQLASTSPSD
jgi:hypothetical protein